MSPGSTTSKILKKGQDLILGSGLHRLIRPFAGGLQRLSYLSKFAEWKGQAMRAQGLTGYGDRFDLYSCLIQEERLERICYYEFGVSKGGSMRWWLDHIRHKDSRFYGFDTFEGIPEAWGTVPKGSYTAHGAIPEVEDPRCTFVKGLFQDTLPGFLQTQQQQQRLVVHLDADLYSSTLFCLSCLAPFLKAGDLLIFDEFNITTHEFRAFLDFRSAFGTGLAFAGESNNYTKTVFKVL